MKTIKTLVSRSMLLILFGLPFFIVTNCSDPQDGLSGINPVSKPKDWIAMLDELFYDAGIIVEKQSSIQDAIDEAQPGEAIYIEPGTYQEEITINKSGIKLIGLSGDNGEKVLLKSAINVTGDGNAEILNIEYKKSLFNNGGRTSTSSGKKSSGAFKVTRKELANKVAHYTFDLKVGSGQFDVVRIHRVVREHRPYQPVNTRGGVLMLHGASLSFEAVFLNAGSDVINEQTSSAFYLASKNIDVWGMDFAWTLVPVETTDFTFMKDWGAERDAQHVLKAMSVARLIRGLTWQGFGRLNVLGYSYGAVVAYAAAGTETQQKPCLRDIKGVVAVDQVMQYAPADEAFRVAACNGAAQIKTQINNGTYRNNNGQTFVAFGSLAINAPNDPSTLLPPALGLNNYQAALFIGVNPIANPPAPFWHFVGGTFADGKPAGLLYSDPSRWFKLLSSLPPYQPSLTAYEARACLCNEEDVSINDHFDKIAVPILYIGAGGAFGTFGDYTSSITASTDITNHTVTLNGDRKIDFGHGDLFLGNDAATLVWEKLRQWLVGHNNVSS